MKLKSHQASTVPDWEKIAPQDRNAWQRVAAETRGIVTLGNALTLLGTLVTINGIHDVRTGKKAQGALKIVTGAVLDRADGTGADMTGTKSPLGEAVDAGADKVLIAYALGTLAADEHMPRGSALAIGAQNTATTAIAVMAKWCGRTIHPGWPGKWGIGIQKVVPAIHALESLAEDQGWYRTARVLGGTATAATVVSVGLGTAGTIQYAYETFRPVPAAVEQAPPPVEQSCEAAVV